MSAPSAAASCGFSRRAASELAARAGRPIEVVAVSAKTGARTATPTSRHSASCEDPVALAQDPGIDVFVELIGGEGGVAKEAVEAALRAGKHVVTANKALLAHHGSGLAALAEKNGVALNFEARWPAAFPSSRSCARACKATTSAASTASSTAPATTS